MGDTITWEQAVSLGRFGGVYAALHAGHCVGDMWVQSNEQADSHYFADRRTPLRGLCDVLAFTGKADFYRSGEGLSSGAFHLDQAWHVGWCAISAAIIAGRG